MPSLSLISSTACRTLVLDFRVDETKFWHKLGIRLPPSKKVIHYAQAHEKVLSNYPKTFLQKKVFHFFQMKKIVKESPEAAKNRLYDVLPLYPRIDPLQHGWLQRNEFFGTDFLNLHNAHTAKHTDELRNSCAVPYPFFSELREVSHAVTTVKFTIWIMAALLHQESESFYLRVPS